MSASRGTSNEQQTDAADLARFGYQQELKRGLGLFDSTMIVAGSICLRLARVVSSAFAMNS